MFFLELLAVEFDDFFFSFELEGKVQPSSDLVAFGFDDARGRQTFWLLNLTIFFSFELVAKVQVFLLLNLMIFFFRTCSEGSELLAVEFDNFFYSNLPHKPSTGVRRFDLSNL